MRRLCSTLVLLVLLLGKPAFSQISPGKGNDVAEAERRHFLQCLAYVYSPALWVSYDGRLFFFPKDEAQAQEIERMKTARSRYTLLRDPLLRYEAVAAAIARSGVGDKWQKMLILPSSATNQNLTPTLDRTLRVVSRYSVSQKYPGGDALLESEGWSGFVMGYGRAAQDRYLTNALLIREGTKSFLAASGEPQRVEAFTDVGLATEEVEVLTRVAAEFAREAAGQGKKPVAQSQADEEFQIYRARATDASPYFQYLLAKAYLEGKGTPKDEQLGLEWMQKAAANGSGDAEAYLNQRKSK